MRLIDHSKLLGEGSAFGEKLESFCISEIFFNGYFALFLSAKMCCKTIEHCIVQIDFSHDNTPMTLFDKIRHRSILTYIILVLLIFVI